MPEFTDFTTMDPQRVRMKPLMAIQMGSSVPLNVSSMTNLANNNGYDKSIPISSTYNINIELPSLAQRKIHKAEIYVPPEEDNTTTIQVTSQPSSPIYGRTSPPPLFRRSVTQGGAASTNQPMRVFHIPFTPPPQHSHHGPHTSNSSRSPLSSPIDENDHDSLLMSSLDDSQDSRSLMSYSTQSHSSSAGVDSACSIETNSDHQSDNVTCDRVIVCCGSDAALALQMSCDSESTCDNLKFLDLLERIGEVCLSYILRKESTKLSMNGTQIGQLVMGDRRNVQIHIEELSQDLSENITIVRAEGRRATASNFVGTFIKDPIRQSDNCMIGKSGVLVCLHKKNKFTPAREFADQLGHHIAHFRPEAVGKPEPKKKATLGRRKPQSGPQTRMLMSQKFLYDNSVTVTEAARRAFVEIKEFALVG